MKVSIRALAGSARPVSSFMLFLIWKFQFVRSRGAQGTLLMHLDSWGFPVSIRALAGSASCRTARNSTFHCVSIRALAGSARTLSRSSTTFSTFQFVRSRGAQVVTEVVDCVFKRFNSCARGERKLSRCRGSEANFVSIRALAGSASVDFWTDMIARRKFQFVRSRGAQVTADCANLMQLSFQFVRSRGAQGVSCPQS